MRYGEAVSREREIALVIRSEDALRIANALARLRMLGPYQLVPASVQRIHDVYFDTPAGALQAQRAALRLRRINGEMLVTFKASLLDAPRQVRTRLEIELPWSRAAFERIARALSARGIGVSSGDAVYQHNARETFRRAGLGAVQERQTFRRVRYVLAASGEVGAELVLDRTGFIFGTQRVHLCEVEIEARRARTRLDVLARHLMQFAPVLQPWHSKLATGLAIQTLLQQGALEELVDADAHLTPAGLDRIRRVVEQTQRGVL
jgi:hypothetical protein